MNDGRTDETCYVRLERSRLLAPDSLRRTATKGRRRRDLRRRRRGGGGGGSGSGGGGGGCGDSGGGQCSGTAEVPLLQSLSSLISSQPAGWWPACRWLLPGGRWPRLQ